MARTQHVVRLTPEQRSQLHTMVARGTVRARAATRAHILLQADRQHGGPRRYDAQIAGALSCSARTVARTRSDWSVRGMAAVEPRRRDRNTSPKLDDEQIARIIAIATSMPPPGHVRWTLRMLARRTVELAITDTLCAETVRTTLKKTGSAPGSRSGS